MSWWVAILIILVVCMLFMAFLLSLVLRRHRRDKWSPRSYSITYKMGESFKVCSSRDGLVVSIPPGMTAREITDRMRLVVETYGYKLEEVDVTESLKHARAEAEVSTVSRWGWPPRNESGLKQ